MVMTGKPPPENSYGFTVSGRMNPKLKGSILLDILILNFVQSRCHNGFTDFLFPLVTALGNGGAVWIAAGVCLAAVKKYRRYGVMLLVSLGVTFLLINVILQPLVARPRPFQQFPGQILLIAAPHSCSFPSGHAGSSFSSAMILLRMNRRVGVFCFIFAALIAFSRVFLFVHYPSDILAGACMGMLCALLVIKLFKIGKNKLRMKNCVTMGHQYMRISKK